MSIIKSRDLPQHVKALMASGGTGLRRVVIKKAKRQWGTGTLLQKKKWHAEMIRLPGIFLELKTKPEGNNRQHWWADQKRIKRERNVVETTLLSIGHPCSMNHYRITRYSPRLLDEHDNLRSSCKHVVDGIAAHCLRPDNAKEFVWTYAQDICPRGCYGIRIEVLIT